MRARACCHAARLSPFPPLVLFSTYPPRPPPPPRYAEPPAPLSACAHAGSDGDLDYFTIHEHEYTLEEIQQLLPHLLHHPAPSTGDSCCLAGLLELHRTQGVWLSSVRYGLLFGALAPHDEAPGPTVNHFSRPLTHKVHHPPELWGVGAVHELARLFEEVWRDVLRQSAGCKPPPDTASLPGELPPGGSGDRERTRDATPRRHIPAASPARRPGGAGRRVSWGRSVSGTGTSSGYGKLAVERGPPTTKERGLSTPAVDDGEGEEEEVAVEEEGRAAEADGLYCTWLCEELLAAMLSDVRFEQLRAAAGLATVAEAVLDRPLASEDAALGRLVHTAVGRASHILYAHMYSTAAWGFSSPVHARDSCAMHVPNNAHDALHHAPCTMQPMLRPGAEAARVPTLSLAFAQVCVPSTMTCSYIRIGMCMCMYACGCLRRCVPSSTMTCSWLGRSSFSTPRGRSGSCSLTRSTAPTRCWCAGSCRARRTPSPHAHTRPHAHAPTHINAHIRAHSACQLLSCSTNLPLTTEDRAHGH